MFGIEEGQALVEALKETAPQLVANLTPQPLPLPALAALCRSLLAEDIPLRDFRRIAEAAADAARFDSDPAALLAQVRQRLGALIVQEIAPLNGPLRVVTLHHELEQLLTQATRAGGGSAHPFEPGLARQVVEALAEAARTHDAEAGMALVTAPAIRPALARLVAPHVADMRVLSFLEIPERRAVEVLAVIGEPVPALSHEAA